MEESTPRLEAHTDYKILSLEDKTPKKWNQATVISAAHLCTYLRAGCIVQSIPLSR
jgi:hypothetical protein